jgi:death-on-curing protein
VEPEFIGLDVVLALHTESLRLFGGTDGLRDPGLLDSALAAAQNAHFYGNGDLFDIAAAYAFHIAQAQAFLDGNKRTAVATSLVFLAANGFPKKPDWRAIYDAMIAIAEKRMTKSELARLLRELFGL